MLTGVLANDLDSAWFEVIKNCFDPIHAKKYVIDKGSFEGHTRYQLHSLTLQVNHPETRPLSPIMPQGIEPPSTDEYIEQYFCEYIMNGSKAINEEYSYGEFIYPHLNGIIEMLKITPATNQAVINIGEPFTYMLDSSFKDLVFPEFDSIEKRIKVYENPPCLRCITWQVVDKSLEIHTFWRSWDLHSGFPTNLGGMQLLNEYIASEVGIESGKMYAYSSGAHVYDYAKSVIEARYNRKFEW